MVLGPGAAPLDPGIAVPEARVVDVALAAPFDGPATVAVGPPAAMGRAESFRPGSRTTIRMMATTVAMKGW